jgi:hypothetical protein
MRLAPEPTAVGIWEWNILTNKIHWDAQMFRIYDIAPTPDGFIDYATWSALVRPEDLPEQRRSSRSIGAAWASAPAPSAPSTRNSRAGW